MIERFEAKVIRREGCWGWDGAHMWNGYAALYDNDAKNQRHAHRFAYRHFIGPIPNGLHIDHICRNRGCVNPWHLRLVTLAENVLLGDGITARNARKTHCKRGHSFDEANTHIDNRGNRSCRTCSRDRMRRYRAEAL